MILILIRLFRRWRESQGRGGQGRGGQGRGQGRESQARGGQGYEAPREGRSAAARGPLALLVHQVRYDLVASLRNPRARFFTFVFPVLMLVVFAGLFGHGTTVVEGVRVKLSQYYVTGILALSIITAGYASLVVSIATARETGVLKRRRATPASPALLIAGQALSTLVIALVMSGILLVVGRLAYGISLPAGALVAIAFAIVVGTLSFACLGYAVAGIIGSPDAAQPVVQATMLPLYFISGVWIPTDRLGHTLNSIASVFPVEHLAAALHHASVHSSIGSALAPKDLAVLGVWALAAAVFAIRRFSWLPSVATG
jgi:ABC-2 type transport system permease protein